MTNATTTIRRLIETIEQLRPARDCTGRLRREGFNHARELAAEACREQLRAYRDAIASQHLTDKG